jgi:hypothetical protein
VEAVETEVQAIAEDPWVPIMERADDTGITVTDQVRDSLKGIAPFPLLMQVASGNYKPVWKSL